MLWALLLLLHLFFHNQIGATRLRDVSTDSALELALVNFHRYAGQSESTYVYAKPFYIHSVGGLLERSLAGVLFTGYKNLTHAIWLGINTAAMQAEIYDQKAGGLDDIQFKLGYDLLKLEDAHGTLYLVGTAPTGNRPCSCICLPTVGTKNGSFGFGLDTQAVAFEIKDCELSLSIDLKYRYVFSSHEYQPVYSRIYPRGTIDVWIALNVPLYAWDVELGYDLWWLNKEKIITAGQLCKKTACALSQKIYLDVGYTAADIRLRPLIAVGASYECAPTNALNQWMMWMTAGITF